MIFTASLVLTGTEGPDDPMSEVLHNHYKTQCLKKVDLRNYELHELFLIRIEKQMNKMDIDLLQQKKHGFFLNLRKLKNSSGYSNMVMYQRQNFMVVIKLIILN